MTLPSNLSANVLYVKGRVPTLGKGQVAPPSGGI